MVPKELAKTRDQTMKAIYKMKEMGFFEKPSEDFQKSLAKDMRKQMRDLHGNFWKIMLRHKYRQGKNPKEEIKAAYTNWIEHEAWRTMEVEQSSRLSINSMGIGPILSSIVFTLMQGLTMAAPGVPEQLTSAVSVMVNAPTEMLSFTGAIIGANSWGFERFPWLLSNDEQKNLQIMGKIFEKSTKHYELFKEGNELAAKIVEITDDELHRIYNPILRTMGIGRFFVKRGIWLWKKWDQHKQRGEYKRKELAGLTGNNEKRMY
jgi:hypothetical protein